MSNNFIEGCDWFTFLNSETFSTLFLHGGNTGGGLGTAVHIDFLHFRIFPVRKLVSYLQALVEFSSGAAVTGGLVILSTVAN